MNFALTLHRIWHFSNPTLEAIIQLMDCIHTNNGNTNNHTNNSKITIRVIELKYYIYIFSQKNNLPFPAFKGYGRFVICPVRGLEAICHLPSSRWKELKYKGKH